MLSTIQNYTNLHPFLSLLYIWIVLCIIALLTMLRNKKSRKRVRREFNDLKRLCKTFTGWIIRFLIFFIVLPFTLFENIPEAYMDFKMWVKSLFKNKIGN